MSSSAVVRFWVVALALIGPACSNGQPYVAGDGGAGEGGGHGGAGAAAGRSGTGGAAGHAGSGGQAGGAAGATGSTGAGGSPGTGGTAGTIGGTGGGGPGTGGIATGGAAGTGGTAGKGGAAGTGGIGGKGGSGGATGGTAGGSGGNPGTGGVTCNPTTQHICSGACVNNNAIATCGTRCDACQPPSGATATCDGSSCGFSCGGSTPKQCLTAGICIASTGCCTSADCPTNSGGQTGSCDTSSHTCNYTCSGSTPKSCTTGSTTICIASNGCCVSSDCTGTCMSCDTTTHTCVAAKSVDDPNGRCAGTCDASGACKSKQGQTCNTVAAGCVSGTTCSPDGYCCDKPCTGSCVACDLVGQQGTCTNIAAKTTPHTNHSPCNGSGSCAGYCDGAGACAYPTTTCASATCSGTSYVPASTCNQGTCTAPSAQVCANQLICSAGACKTSCSADSDCLSNYFCNAGTCTLAATSIAVGTGTSCAILQDGTVRCWGANNYEQLGATSFGAQSLTPVTVPGLPSGATALAGGADFMCSVFTDGSVWCWGGDVLGQLGNGKFGACCGNTGPTAFAPAKVVNLPSPVTAIGAGYYHVCAIVNKATVWCWGNNANAELGTGTATTTTPVGIDMAVEANSATQDIPTSVAANEESSYVLTSGDGLVLSWGGSESGQLGNGSTSPTTMIQDVGLPTSAISVSGGTIGAYACAVLTDGSVWCWGDNTQGALGDGMAEQFASSPVKVTGLPAVATSVSASNETTCAILHNGALYCWGHIPNSSTPVQITGFAGTPKQVSVGYFNVCVLVNDGAVWCWGGNNSGDLGDGSMQDSPVPVQVAPW